MNTKSTQGRMTPPRKAKDPKVIVPGKPIKKVGKKVTRSGEYPGGRRRTLTVD
jgi:hypothetical protein